MVLALAWLAHAMLSRRNPRWRVVLWRACVVGLALVVVLSAVPPIVTYHLLAARPAFDRVRADGNPFVARRGPWRSGGRHGSVSGGNRLVASPSGADPSHPRSDFPTGVAGAAAGTGGKPPGVPGQDQGIRWGAGIVSWLWSIWLAGVLVLTARLILGSLGLARIVRRSSDAPDAIARGMPRRSPSAWDVDRIGPARLDVRDVATPCLAGLWRPVLLLPERECEEVRPDDLRAILAHELAHARNHDLAWNLAAHLASIVLWFHPLAWRIRSAHAAACDAVCDAVAADLLGDVASYGRTLARLAVRAAWPSPAHGLAMARTSDVRRRLDALNRKVFRTPLSWRRVMPASSSGACSLVLIGGFGFTRAEQAPPTGNDPRPAMRLKPADQKTAGKLTLRAVSAETGEPIEGVSISYRGPLRREGSSRAPSRPARTVWRRSNGLQVRRSIVCGSRPARRGSCRSTSSGTTSGIRWNCRH